MSSLQPERTLLHYRIISKISRGGMGEVYKAEDTKLGRPVAIKLLPSETMEDATARRRLLKEAQSASALNHPGIVTIHSIDAADGLDFIVMEYLEGQTLKALIHRGEAIAPLSLFDLGIQLTDALEAAHAIGLVHRDIKPENIFIMSRGQAKLLDFGLAKIFRRDPEQTDPEAPTLTNLTDVGTVVGTVNYMSPEQTRGEPLDARSDIFSLGSVLYEAATGRMPFAGPSVLTIMHNIAAVDPLPPSSFRPELPREFDVILERALAKDIERRYSSVREMGQALKDLRGVSTQSGAPVLTATETAPDESTPSFVGRGDEVNKLDDFLRQAIEGSGRVVFITGEPGIGKTALADEFLRRSRKHHSNLLISRGRCVEQYGTGEAYLPFLDAVSALLEGPGRDRVAASLRTYAPTWCLQLPAAFTSSGAMEKLQLETIGATKERMLREMGDALGVLATSSPVVLLLEDLHWADPSSIDLLRHLCQRISSQRLLIAGTFRPEDIERSNHPLKGYKAEMQSHNLCVEIVLGLLSRDHISEYLSASFAPNDFPPELATLIQQKTEGHPLFATSLAQFLAERGDIARVNEHWSLIRPLSEMDLEAPESVRSMIRKKIDALEEEERRTLQYASVEGEAFHSTVLAKLLGADEIELEERLAHLERNHRLILTLGEEELPDGSIATRYRFAHALYQNSLYGDLVSKRRILLHRQAGEQLAAHYKEQSSRIATQLAMHFERGRDFEQAVEFLIHAGDNATKLFANAEAEEHYTHALELVAKLASEPQHEKLCSLYQKRGAANMALGRFSQSVDDYTAMLEQGRALGSLEKESAALNALSFTLFFSHRLEEMEARSEEALAVAERAGNEALRLDTMGLVALKHLCYGELDEGKPILDDIMKAAGAIDYKPAMLTALTWRACLYFFQTDYERAVEYATAGRKLGTELRNGFLLLTSVFFHGLSQGNLGRMSESLAILEDGIKMARRNGDSFWFPRMPNCIGWIHRELQDFEGALKYDQQGRDVGREYRVLEAEANSLINLGIDYSHSGKNHETLAAFDEVHEIFGRDAWFRWRYNIRLQAATAEHWLSQGNLEKTSKFALQLHEMAARYQAHKYVAVAHKLLAQVALAKDDPAEAQKQFEAGLEELRQFPAPLVEWKIYADLGRLKLRLGDRGASQAAFARASEIVNNIADNTMDEKLKQGFLDSDAVREVLNGATKTRTT